jgi:hypothetical protein
MACNGSTGEQPPNISMPTNAAMKITKMSRNTSGSRDSRDIAIVCSSARSIFQRRSTCTGASTPSEIVRVSPLWQRWAQSRGGFESAVTLQLWQGCTDLQHANQTERTQR